MSRFAVGGPPGAKFNDMSHFGPFLRVSCSRPIRSSFSIPFQVNRTFWKAGSGVDWLGYHCVVFCVFRFLLLLSRVVLWKMATCFPQGRGTLRLSHKGSPKVVQKLSQFWFQVVSNLSQNYLKVSQKCFKVVSNLSQKYLIVVPQLSKNCRKSFQTCLIFFLLKLSRNWIKIVPQLSLSYPKWYPKVFHVVPIWVVKWCPLGFHVATRWVEWVNMILLMRLE